MISDNSPLLGTRLVRVILPSRHFCTCCFSR